MSNFLLDGFEDSPDSKVKNVPNLIRYYISDHIMKALMHLCLRVDIPDNNVKAEVAKEIIGPEFEEVGTGTNRIAFRHNGLVVKVALDRRGLSQGFVTPLYAGTSYLY